MSTKKKVFYGISVDYVGTILVAIAGFVVVPFYFKYVSVAEYGVWLAIQGVIGMLSVAEFGGDVYLITKISDDSVFNDASAVTAQISTMILLKSVLSVLFIVSGVVVFFSLDRIISSGIDVSIVNRIFVLALAVLVIGTFSSTLSTILSARHHYSLVNSITSFFAIFAAALPLLFLAQGLGVLSFALALFISVVVQALLLLGSVMLKYPTLRVKLSSVSIGSIKDTYNYSKKFYFLRLAAMFRTNYMVLAISHLTSASYVTIYTITNRIPSVVPMFFSKIGTGLFPTFAKFYAAGDMAKIKSIYLRLAKIVWRLVLFFFILVVGLNGDFVRLWVGTDKFGGFWMMVFLAVNMLVLSVNNPLGTIVYSTGKYEKWPQWAVVEIFLSVVASYVCAKIWGVDGIVFAFMLASMVTAVYLFQMVNRVLGITVREFFRNTLSYALLPNVVTICLMSLLLVFGIHTWRSMIFAVVALTVSHVLFYEGVKVFLSKEVGFKKKILAALQI
ncbi:MAG: hypothetical protein A2X31_07505 [Elusimicrobia bacterium GWB2_63_22]|nr:MAG: hypothetical protein A2X31_07505 [Elusimicrobia bacterium GWB2_63_22]